MVHVLGAGQSDKTWANAKSYCENYDEGGYTDWRMPTQGELAGLYAVSAFTGELHDFMRQSSYYGWGTGGRKFRGMNDTRKEEWGGKHRWIAVNYGLVSPKMVVIYGIYCIE